MTRAGIGLGGVFPKDWGDVYAVGLEGQGLPEVNLTAQLEAATLSADGFSCKFRAAPGVTVITPGPGDLPSITLEY